MPPESNDPWLTIGELAKLLRVSVPTIYRWRKQDKGPKATKTGGQLRWKPEEIDRWREEGGDDPK